MLHYTECGLDYIWLHNGYQVEPLDGDEYFSVEDAEELHRRIAMALITHPARLRGQEVRFIRSLLNQTQKDLADRLGTQRVTVARWEAGLQTAIPGAADRLLRFLVCTHFLDRFLSSAASEERRREAERFLVSFGRIGVILDQISGKDRPRIELHHRSPEEVSDDNARWTSALAG